MLGFSAGALAALATAAVAAVAGQPLSPDPTCPTALWLPTTYLPATDTARLLRNFKTRG